MDAVAALVLGHSQQVGGSLTLGPHSSCAAGSQVTAPSQPPVYISHGSPEGRYQQTHSQQHVGCAATGRPLQLGLLIITSRCWPPAIHVHPPQAHGILSALATGSEPCRGSLLSSLWEAYTGSKLPAAARAH